MMVNPARLVILYGSGGLSDVGRHAIVAALERTDVSGITVLTQKPELLEEPNWNCGCVQPHSFSAEQRSRFTVVQVTSWDASSLSSHFKDANAVVSCLGNRQPFYGDRIAKEGNDAVIRGMKENGISRAVVITSVGIEEDQPAMEFSSIAKTFFNIVLPTIGRDIRRDLTMMERAYRATDLDFLLVRPVGLDEKLAPCGKWFVQKEKFKDVLGTNIAKLDLARYMVEEALNPTRRKTAAVVGGEPPAEDGADTS